MFARTQCFFIVLLLFFLFSHFANSLLHFVGNFRINMREKYCKTRAIGEWDMRVAQEKERLSWNVLPVFVCATVLLKMTVFDGNRNDDSNGGVTKIKNIASNSISSLKSRLSIGQQEKRQYFLSHSFSFSIWFCSLHTYILTLSHTITHSHTHTYKKIHQHDKYPTAY